MANRKMLIDFVTKYVTDKMKDSRTSPKPYSISELRSDIEEALTQFEFAHHTNITIGALRKVIHHTEKESALGDAGLSYDEYIYELN